MKRREFLTGAAASVMASRALADGLSGVFDPMPGGVGPLSPLGRVRPSWVPASATFFVGYANQQYYNQRIAQLSDVQTLTRSSIKEARNSSGIYSQVASGAPAITNIGESIEPASSSIISIDFSTWTTGTGVTKTQNAVGVDGLSNSAWTLVQSANGLLQKNLSVSADTVVRCYSLFLQKTVGAVSVYPAISLGYAGAGGIQVFAVIDTTNGVITADNSTSPNCGIEDTGGNYWRVWYALANNGGTTFFAQFYPAYNSDGTITKNITVTGTQLAQWPMVEPNATRPSSPMPGFSRSADVATWLLPAGTNDADVLFANGARQLLSQISGNYSVDPTTLYRDEVASIAWPATRPLLWDKFQRADGAIGSAPSGQAYVQINDGGSTHALSVISSNQLVTPAAPGGASTLAYNGIDFGRNVQRMMTTIIAGDITSGTSITLSANPEGLSQVADITDSSVHIRFGIASVACQFFAAGVSTTVATFFYTATWVKGSTYTFGWWLDAAANTLYVQLPDGQVVRSVDSRWNLHIGRYGIYEVTFDMGQTASILTYIEGN